jgi:hypothetical protein
MWPLSDPLGDVVPGVCRVPSARHDQQPRPGHVAIRAGRRAQLADRPPSTDEAPACGSVHRCRQAIRVPTAIEELVSGVAAKVRGPSERTSVGTRRVCDRGGRLATFESSLDRPRRSSTANQLAAMSCKASSTRLQELGLQLVSVRQADDSHRAPSGIGGARPSSRADPPPRRLRRTPRPLGRSPRPDPCTSERGVNCVSGDPWGSRGRRFESCQSDGRQKPAESGRATRSAGISCPLFDLAPTVHIGPYWLVIMQLGGFWEDRVPVDEMGWRSLLRIRASKR